MAMRRRRLQRKMARWTKANVKKLIKLRGVVLKHHFKARSTQNHAAWALIKSMLPCQHDVRLISKKWSNLVQKYKTIKELIKEQSAEHRMYTIATWPYYEAMDEVFQSCRMKMSSSSFESAPSLSSVPLPPGSSSPPPASSSPPPASSSLPPVSPPPSYKPHSQQFQPCYSDEEIAPKSKKKQKKYSYMKILLKQNNKLIRLLNQLVVAAGGEGLTGEIEVPLDVD